MKNPASHLNFVVTVEHEDVTYEGYFIRANGIVRIHCASRLLGQCDWVNPGLIQSVDIPEEVYHAMERKIVDKLGLGAGR